MNWELLKIGGSGWNTAILGVLLLGAAFIWFTYQAPIRQFCSEVWAELLKCSWPWDSQQEGLKKYKELIDSTIVVVISTILLGAFVTSSDFILVKVVGFITRFNV